jgi:hypothetical protein
MSFLASSKRAESVIEEAGKLKILTPAVDLMK